MSQYADSEYYMNTFHGVLISVKDLDKYLQQASEKIDEVTLNRIVGIGFDKLTDFQKEKIQLAVCYQADYIFQNGYNDENKQEIASYSVLDISVTPKEKIEKTEAEKKCMSEMAYSLIKKTGLTCGVIR